MQRMITRAELARLVDHTLLKPEATPADVQALADEAATLGVYSICISPNMIKTVNVPDGVLLATVCGFPSGKHTTTAKATEAVESVASGADEVDMVIDIGALKAGDIESVTADIAAVRGAVGKAVLKVIIESVALTEDEIVAACRAAESAGADFVKTSTGFNPAGGASVEAVRLMRRTVGDRLGVKASGGIRDWDTAVAMVEAGANRLGLSGTAAVLAGGQVGDQSY